MTIYCKNFQEWNKKQIPSNYFVCPVAKPNIAFNSKDHLLSGTEYWMNVSCYCQAAKRDVPKCEGLCVSKNGKPFEACQFFKQGINPFK